MTRRIERGFTLLELTAAMLVTSLIILTVASSLAAIAGAWERGERRTAEREAIRVLTRRIGRELSGVGQGPFGTGSGFRGERDELGFVAVGDEGPRRLELLARQGRIVMTESILRRADQAETATEIALAEPVDRMAFSYYDPAGKAWRYDWPANAGRPPSLVRLEVVLGESPRLRRVPALVFPIHAGRVISAQEVDPLD